MYAHFCQFVYKSSLTNILYFFIGMLNSVDNCNKLIYSSSSQSEQHYLTDSSIGTSFALICTSNGQFQSPDNSLHFSPFLLELFTNKVTHLFSTKSALHCTHFNLPVRIYWCEQKTSFTVTQYSEGFPRNNFPFFSGRLLKHIFYFTSLFLQSYFFL